MKKFRSALLTVCMLALIFCLGSCMLLPTQGEAGLSAYEIAVRNGFEGSEQEWLDSLKGETVIISEKCTCEELESESETKESETSEPSKPSKPNEETESELESESEAETEVETEVEAETEAESEQTPPTVIEQTINQNITNNQITIQGESTDITFAANKGLSSIVSIYSSFTSTSLKKYSSAGSGVIYRLDDSGSAFIITNYHVVYDVDSATSNKISDDITVYLYGMEYTEHEIEATYVGGSMNYDIAVLYVEESEIIKEALENGSVSAATLAQDEVTAGQTVIVIGNPDAGGISVTSGVVSVDSEYIEMTAVDEVSTVEFRVIRTDAPINSGNSGGGMFNTKGELIGIVNAKAASTSIENIGYAIPLGVAKAVSDNIIHYCFEDEDGNEMLMRPLLGIKVTVEDVWTEYDTETGLLKKHEKSVVAEVSEGSLAYGALQVNDVIKSITIGEKTVEIDRQYKIIDTVLGAFVDDVLYITVERVVDSEITEVVVEITVTEACLSATK